MTPPAQRGITAAAAALLVGLAGACGAKAFDHGNGPVPEFDPEINSFTTGVGDSGTIDEGHGNYPLPAVTRCGDVLGDMPPIDGLASAWAIMAVPNATMAGEPVETGSMLLRLSDDAIRACGDAPRPNDFFATSGPFSSSSSGFFGPTSDGSSSTRGASDDSDTTTGGTTDGYTGEGRTLELLLGPAELTLGEHPIESLARPSVTLYGDGSTTAFGDEASIELLRIDDDCVIGVVRGFESDAGEPFLVGGFVAQTCQRQCIPADGDEC